MNTSFSVRFSTTAFTSSALIVQAIGQSLCSFFHLFFTQPAWTFCLTRRWTHAKTTGHSRSPLVNRADTRPSALMECKVEEMICVSAKWCPRRGSNPHGRSRGILSPLCLAISPPGLKRYTNFQNIIGEEIGSPVSLCMFPLG